MKTWQIVLLVLGCVFGSILLIFGLPALIATRSVNNIIDDARDSANQRTASLVISSVQLAYSRAYMENQGEYPSLEQVKANFNEDYATWNNDYLIQTENFNCNVEVVNNNLIVTCLEEKTNSTMTLSN